MQGEGLLHSLIFSEGFVYPLTKYIMSSISLPKYNIFKGFALMGIISLGFVHGSLLTFLCTCHKDILPKCKIYRGVFIVHSALFGKCFPPMLPTSLC